MLDPAFEIEWGSLQKCRLERGVIRGCLPVDFEGLQSGEGNRLRRAGGHESPRWVTRTLVPEDLSHED